MKCFFQFADFLFAILYLLSFYLLITNHFQYSSLNPSQFYFLKACFCFIFVFNVLSVLFLCQRKYGEEMLQSMSISNASYYWQDPIYLQHNIIIKIHTHKYTNLQTYKQWIEKKGFIVETFISFTLLHIIKRIYIHSYKLDKVY